MADQKVPHLSLANGALMPQLGFGTWKMNGDICINAVKAAIDAGYRHIDTAYAYVNEVEVGQALRDKIADGTVKREDIFLTTKLWNTHHSHEDAKLAMKKSLENLGVDYVDLFLIHWPMSHKRTGPFDELFPLTEDHQIDYDDVDPLITWKALEECVDEGYTKAIGLANFNQEQIQKIIDNARHPLANVQLEFHAYNQQKNLIKYLQEKKIPIVGYSPLGSADRPWRDDNDPVVMNDPVLKNLAEKYHRTTAKVMLRWVLQSGIGCIPKSTNPDRIKANLDVFDFELSAEDMEAINALDRQLGIVIPTYCVINGTTSWKPLPNSAVRTLYTP